MEQSGLVDGSEVDVFEAKDGGAHSLKEAAAGILLKQDETGDWLTLMEERADLEGALVFPCGERDGDEGGGLGGRVAFAKID